MGRRMGGIYERVQLDTENGERKEGKTYDISSDRNILKSRFDFWAAAYLEEYVKVS